MLPASYASSKAGCAGCWNSASRAGNPVHHRAHPAACGSVAGEATRNDPPSRLHPDPERACQGLLVSLLSSEPHGGARLAPWRIWLFPSQARLGMLLCLSWIAMVGQGEGRSMCPGRSIQAPSYRRTRPVWLRAWVDPATPAASRRGNAVGWRFERRLLNSEHGGTHFMAGYMIDTAAAIDGLTAEGIPVRQARAIVRTIAQRNDERSRVQVRRKDERPGIQAESEDLSHGRQRCCRPQGAGVSGNISRRDLVRERFQRGSRPGSPVPPEGWRS